MKSKALQEVNVDKEVGVIFLKVFWITCEQPRLKQQALVDAKNEQARAVQ